MASSKEHCTKWLTKTLTYLKEKKRVREQDCDDIISEYCLLTEVVTEVTNPVLQSSILLLTGWILPNAQRRSSPGCSKAG